MSKEKEWIETEWKCPECGEIIWKHFHRKDNYHNQTFSWYYYYCKNQCDLDCRNCIPLIKFNDGTSEFYSEAFKYITYIPRAQGKATWFDMEGHDL